MTVLLVILVGLAMIALVLCGSALLLLELDSRRVMGVNRALQAKLKDLRAAQRIHLASWQAEHDLLAEARQHLAGNDKS